MNHLSPIFWIGIGGAAGSIARYLVNISPAARVFDRFPFPTFIINVVGSFLIGLLVILLADKFDPPETVRMGVIVGFLGAFTTFSTFEFEIYGLFKEGHAVLALFYMVASVVTGFCGLAAGIALAKKFI
jgi:CrcB protein